MAEETVQLIATGGAARRPRRRSSSATSPPVAAFPGDGLLRCPTSPMCPREAGGGFQAFARRPGRVGLRVGSFRSPQHGPGQALPARGHIRGLTGTGCLTTRRQPLCRRGRLRNSRARPSTSDPGIIVPGLSACTRCMASGEHACRPLPRPPRHEALADRIVDVHVTLAGKWPAVSPGRPTAWGMSDDWGTQSAAFVSFDLWMDFFFPRYKRIFDATHAAGYDVWVHLLRQG